MFRKLVSGLSFSPALVGQLGFYVKRLRKEEITRRLGLILTVLAVIMQSFAVFRPAEQALASSRPDVIPGGVSSVKQIVDQYDAGAKGQNDFKDLMEYMGITRDELASLDSKVVYICSTDKSIISFGRVQHYSASEGSLTHNVPRQTGGFSIFYSVPLYRFDSVNNSVNCYDAYVGNSAKAGWFAIMRKCGNVQIKKNIQKFPKGHFVSATCRNVLGFAYDERQTNIPVKVYLYFDGQPGKGKQYGPINANLGQPASPVSGNHGFNFAVPEEYQKLGRSVQVWAVMEPLPGWNAPTVQFDNVVEIPGNCVPPKTASCDSLNVIQTNNKVKLEAKAVAEQASMIQGYKFSILDTNGNIVKEQSITSSALQESIQDIELTPGKYTARVVVITAIGEQTSPDCSKEITITEINRCPYYGSTLEENDPNCLPCPYGETIWIDSPECNPQISLSKEAKNLTKDSANANGTVATVSDRIEFTIYTTNISSSEVTYTIDEQLSDVLEYARLIDNGGGNFNSTNNVLSWKDIKIGANQTDVRRFTVQVNDVIPATPRGANDPAAFNCVMTNAYGNTIEIGVNCPPTKAVESAVKRLPETGPGANIVFSTILIVLVTYFYMRSRLMKKEINIIHREFNGGSR
ncbi:MAG TPA: hypothetical protein VLA77_00075 [Candidatus Saccharimonadales bacterium]|nr:hypothetical protein [Candidatus Saccharimonadales bacterium]